MGATAIHVMPALMLTLVLIYMVGVTFSFKPENVPWQLPAVMSAFFFVWSIITIAKEGFLGFWAEHTSDYWGNQIWFDLIFGVAISWTLVLPRARELEMNVVAWLVVVVATANVGFLAMIARILYLEKSNMGVPYEPLND